MIELSITPDIEKAPWYDAKDAFAAGVGKVIRVGRLPRGLQSGKSTATILVELPDGRRIAAETSLALFVGAARVLKTAEEEATGATRRN